MTTFSTLFYIGVFDSSSDFWLFDFFKMNISYEFQNNDEIIWRETKSFELIREHQSIQNTCTSKETHQTKTITVTYIFLLLASLMIH